MDDLSAQLQRVLDREIELHRDLLVLARGRHLLLRQGRPGQLDALRRAEARKVDELRQLEELRGRLAAALRDPASASELANATGRIAALLRQLGAVERANRILLTRSAVRSSPTGDGIGVWSAAPAS